MRRIIFDQLMNFVPWQRFQTCVKHYEGDLKTYALSTEEFFKIMAFAQISGRESLAETVACLNAVPWHLHQIGLPGPLVRSNIAHANHHRDWRIFRDFAKILIEQARELFQTDQADSHRFSLDACVYALDSTTVDLCMSLFPWAHFRRSKSAIKMHVALDLLGKIPCFVRISKGKMHDVNIMDVIPWEAGSWYVMDRAYVDFKRLYRTHLCGAFFVTRAKSNTKYVRVYSNPVDKSMGVLCDQRIRFTGRNTRKNYPELIRRIRFIDTETGRKLIFLTNNMIVPAETIALLYKNRWHVELLYFGNTAQMDQTTFTGKTVFRS